MLNLGLLILRVVLGLIFVAHGGQKLFGWFGGQGMKGWISLMEKSRVRPAWLWGGLGALAEFGGGILVILGLLNPLGSLAIIATMLVAIIQVHWKNGFWNTNKGFEFNLINIAAALALAMTGPGTYSLDAIMGTGLPEPVALVVGLLLVIIAVILEQVSRTHPTVQTPQPGGRA